MGEGFEAPLWRALVVYRLAAVGYAVALILHNFRGYRHPPAGLVAGALMLAWTAAATWAYARPERRGWPLLVADLAVAGAALVASPFVEGAQRLHQGLQTLPVAWIAAPVVAWAIAGGRRRGAVAAVLMGVGDLWVRGRIDQNTLTGTVLMILAGVAVGHIARLGVTAEQRLQQAVELEAANRERDRLARGIHDSVLQVLALVARRGRELGGEAAELGRLAGDQETALRALVGTGPRPAPSGQGDLAAALRGYAGPTVTIAAPAGPVLLLPAATVAELTAAVGSALDNVAVHAGPGARAWVLVEDEPEAVTVTVRDDGRGIPDGRLDRAEADGRLGIAQSIRGRVRDLGGTVAISSPPGLGTELELRVPR